MDLKEFAGKDVVIQFKPGLAWYAHCATDNGVPMLKLSSPKDPAAVASPLLRGEITEAGHLLICTDSGGVVKVCIDPDSIFTVCCVEKSATGPVSQFAVEEKPSPIIIRPAN